MLAGFCFGKGWLNKTPWEMAIFGFFAVLLWIGPLLDCSHIFLMLTTVNLNSVVATFAASAYMNVTQAVSTAIVLLLLGRPLLDRLERVKVKYGMLEGKNKGDK